MIAIIDYGVGNLFSLKSSLQAIGENAVVTRDRAEIHRADRIILPGVGAFGDAADKLRGTGMADAVREEALAGKPLLGICLGMQLLFDRSYEYGMHAGLGLVPGEVRPLEGVVPAGLDIPHMGWNALRLITHTAEADANAAAVPEYTPAGAPVGRSPLFADIQDGECVYFVHSYAAFDCDANLTASAEYGIEVTAAVQNRNVYGTQFHPEKSGEAGMRILKAFAGISGERVS